MKMKWALIAFAVLCGAAMAQWTGNQFGQQPRPPREPFVNKPVLECDLALEIFPMFYTPIIRQSAFRLRFDSRCMQPKTVEFQVFYGDDRFINWNFHPTTINLLLWGNWYQIRFEAPNIIDRYDILKSLMYQNATLINEKEPVMVDLKFENQNFLLQQQYNSFTRSNLQKIADLPQVFTCYTRQQRMPGFFNRVMERENNLRMSRMYNIPIEDPVLMADHVPSQPFPDFLRDQLNFTQTQNVTRVIVRPRELQSGFQPDSGMGGGMQGGMGGGMQGGMGDGMQGGMGGGMQGGMGGGMQGGMGGGMQGARRQANLTEQTIRAEYSPTLNVTNPAEAIEEQIRLQIRNNTIATLQRRFFVDDIQIFCEVL